MRRARTALIALSLIGLGPLGLAACGPTPGSPPLYKDRDMQNAVAEARSTLPIFFDAWKDPAEAYSDFRVTVIMPSSAYGRD